MKTKASAATLLKGVLESLGRCLNPQSARHIVALRATPAANRRLARLARKSDEGRLTPEEQTEYHLFLEVADFAAALQAKARRHLAESKHA